VSQVFAPTSELSLNEKRALAARLLRQRARESKAYPLSFAQERLWFLNRLEPNLALYNIATAVRLTGKLDLAALEQALSEMVARHESLRIRFTEDEGVPVQRIGPAKSVGLPLIDLSHLPLAEREAAARRLVQSEALEPFDLDSAPAFRSRLVRLGEEEHLALFTMHHIISDGWSMGVFIREMSALYNAFANREPSLLPALPIQYVDYAVWQREWLTGEVLQQQLAYWKQQLGSAHQVLNLPTGRLRPPVQSFRGATKTVALSESLVASLKEFSSSEGATLFMTLLAAFKTLLYRYTGQQAIAVGTPIAGRTRAELEGLIGFFVNTLVMKSELEGNLSFRELMRRVKKVTLGAYAHQDLPFEKLVEELHPDRSLSHMPLFQVAFLLQAANESAIELSGVNLRPLETNSDTAKFDLTLAVTSTSRQRLASIEYNTDLFDEATISRMLGHFTNLLEAIVADSDAQLRSLAILSKTEAVELAGIGNDTAREYPAEKCIHQLFEEQAQRRPEATAVVFKERALTYRELNLRANQLAHTLLEMGAGPDVLVAVCMERSPEMIIGLLGILKAGAAYLPLDPKYPRQRLAFMLEDAKVKIILGQRKTVELLPQSVARVVCLDTDWHTISRQNTDVQTDVCSENLAYVIYTSGSTGEPKGVEITHKNVNRLLFGTDYAELGSDQAILQMAPLAFDASTFEIWGALLHGGRLVQYEEEIPTARKIAEAVAAHKVTTIWLTAALFNAVVDESAAALSAAKQVLTGGEPLSPAPIRRAKEAFGETKLINGYGPTESTTFTCCHLIESVEEGRSIPIGKPIANTRVYILDGSLNAVPLGVVGELHIGGAGLARGYLNRPALTADKFIPDPFGSEPGGRLYKSGDLARYRSDGTIEFCGRVDHQVKIRGFRIELEEIEAALRRHEDVQEAVVIARQEGQEQRLIGYLVGASGRAPSATEVAGFLRARLPEYMIPTTFLVLDQMPKTLNGKIDRNALPAPSQVHPKREKTEVAPRDFWELQLTQFWQELLGPGRIGVTDNFFDLGGHSLLAVRLLSRINKRFNKELPLSILFQEPTIEQLAVCLRQQPVEAQSSPLIALQPSGSRPPFFCVHPVGGNVFCYLALAQCLGNGQPFYAFQSPGLYEPDLALISVEEMASRYLAAMRQVQPDGPYLLGGWSMGGVVAFEMANQLIAQGQAVGLLALFDSWAPKADGKSARFDDLELISAFARDLGIDLAVPRAFAANSEAPSRKELLTQVLERAHLSAVLPPDLNLAQVGRLVEVFGLNLEALRRYQPTATSVPLTLFGAVDHESSTDEPQRGWRDFAEAGINFYAVPGDHYAILREPNVGQLADILKEYLDQASPL
jgi:amino acid adenylation domain-containing protein